MNAVSQTVMEGTQTTTPAVTSFFDEATFTVSHIVIDPETRCCAIVDPVLDYDPKSGRTKVQSADALIQYVKEYDLTVEWIIETHVHADHLSAAPYLKYKLGGRSGIGEHVKAVQEVFKGLFNVGTEFATDGRQFDHLFEDGETFKIGGLHAEVMHTPGHTPACVTYVIGDAAFVGDTLFMPDYGTARCDFPGGSAHSLFLSIRKIFSLPPATRLFMCHDYMPNGREVAWETTVADEQANNIHVHKDVGEDDFVSMRTARDATLHMPVLILPAVQVNMRAGELPPPEDNGTRYLKIPLNAL